MRSAMAPRHYIAVIDDDESLCRSLARLLQQAGFHAITYPSAEVFLADPLRRYFDCLLVDVQLGGLSGIEMHSKLKEQGNRTPVVYITAFDDPRAREEALAMGCAGYFRKSDSGFDILETVRRLTTTPTT
jgi:FixJ family two-component response regulator